MPVERDIELEKEEVVESTEKAPEEKVAPTKTIMKGGIEAVKEEKRKIIEREKAKEREKEAIPERQKPFISEHPPTVIIQPEQPKFKKASLINTRNIMVAKESREILFALVFLSLLAFLLYKFMLTKINK